MGDVNPFSCINLMVDCGAPSLYNRLSKKVKSAVVMGSTFRERKFDDYSYSTTPEYDAYRLTYMSFLQEFSPHIQQYTNLDVINNPDLTWKNQQILESEGLHPIPVYHLGCDRKWLKHYLDRYEYIALGGLIPNKTADLLPILKELFKKYICDDRGYPRVKVHGFACTSTTLIWQFPWWTVDSTTARKLAMYGHIYLPETSNMKTIKSVTISSKPVVGELHKAGFFSLEAAPFVPKNEQMKVTPKVKDRVIKAASAINCTWDDLCQNYMERMLFNHIYYSDFIRKEIPEWPWSMKSRQSKEGAHERFAVYIAGSFSKKEEEWFWTELDRRPGTQLALRTRLHSFFYETQVRHIIDLKNKGVVNSESLPIDQPKSESNEIKNVRNFRRCGFSRTT